MCASIRAVDHELSLNYETAQPQQLYHVQLIRSTSTPNLHLPHLNSDVDGLEEGEY